MNSKNQQAAIRYLQENGEATLRELANALGVTNKKIHNLLQNMQRYGRLSREGKKYRLAPSWQEKVCIAKSALERQTAPKRRCGAGVPPELERVSGTQNFWEPPGSR